MRSNGRGRRSDSSGSDSKFTPFILGAVAGGVVGAALALMYAPAEGSELRRGVSEKFDDITDGINSILSNARTSAEKMLNEGHGLSDQIVDTARERANDLIEDAERAMDEARKRSANGSTPNGSGTANGSGANMASGTQGDGSDDMPSGFQGGL